VIENRWSRGLSSSAKEIDMKAKDMKSKAKKATKKEIICGNLDNIQEASRELDHTMKVVWTSAGFWACPKA
jgi:hypothetical protein